MAATGDDVLQRYLTNPPVIEAVAGIEFRARPMDVVALVRETSKWSADYPVVSSQPPLPPSRPVGQPGPELQFMQGAGPSRLWAVSEDGSWLVQSQEDRVLVNWRKVAEGAKYAGFDAMRERLIKLHKLLDRPQGVRLSPRVAEFSYVNQIEADVRDLHETYAIFQKPERKLPGDLVAERYEAVTRLQHEHGLGQVTLTIEPAAGTPPTTMLNVSAKFFAGKPLEESDFTALVDAAHDASKEAFFAVVSDATMSRWEGTP